MSSARAILESVSDADLEQFDRQGLLELQALAERELTAIRGSSADTLNFISDYRPQILHPSRGWIEFEPYGYQGDIIGRMDAGEPLAINKARQIGISTAVMIQRLAQCLHPKTTIIVTNKQDTAAELVRIARDAYKGCDPQPPMRLTTDNTWDLRFDTGGRIKAEAASQNPGRSYSASCIILDELAYWPWQDRMWRAVSPTISRGGLSVACSTPDMEGDRFERICSEAKLDSTPRRYLELPWEQCPEYGDEWYAEKRGEYTAAEFASEFCCQFGRASDAVFSGRYIERAIELSEANGRLPKQPAFALGGDIAGEGRSLSVLIALEVSRRPAVVAGVRAWESLPAPSLQAEIERAAAEYGCDPWLDETGLGWGILQNLGIPATGVTITGGHAVTKGSKEAGGVARPAGRKRWNVPRTQLINNLVLGFEQEQIAIPREEQELAAGLRAYRWDKRGSAGADYVDALAITWWAATHSPQRRGRAAVAQRQPIGYV